MTKKDFEFIAAAIADKDVDDCIRSFLAYHFGRRLEAANPRFDLERFVRACGVKD